MTGARLAAIGAIATLAFAFAPAAQAATAVLRGLDKTTGIARDFNAPVGRKVKFGTLDIVARSCAKRAPEEVPEVSVYLDVVDHPIVSADQTAPDERKIFSGWMFASSPALNALEHSSYDIWAIDCKA